MADTHLMTVPQLTAPRYLTGEQTVEIRISTEPNAPFGCVAPGDTVYIKPEGQGVIGKATVHRVDQYDGLSLDDLDRLQAIYSDKSGNDGRVWEARATSNFATIITLDRVHLITDESNVPSALMNQSGSSWVALSQTQQNHRRAA